MIKNETDSLKTQLESSADVFSSQLFELRKELKSKAEASSQDGLAQQFRQLDTALGTLKQGQTLLKERIARIDYTNQQEDYQFQLTCVQQQLQDLGAQVPEHKSPLRAFFQLHRPSTRSSAPESHKPKLHRDLTEFTIIGKPLSATAIPYTRKRGNSASPWQQRQSKMKFTMIPQSTTVLERAHH